MCYDPLGRLVRTDQPNGTYALVLFDAWKQETWDENDTVLTSAWYARWKQQLEGATQLLPFIRGFVPRWSASPTDFECAGELCRALSVAAPAATDVSWLLSPTGGVPPLWKNILARAKDFKRAASLSAKHADTPSVAHLDSLGRVFLTIADNGKDAGGAERKYLTRVELDVEGNQLSVTDARGIRTLAQAFDVLRRRVHAVSPDAGESRTLFDVGDKPIRAWDPRGDAIRCRHDPLQRPTHVLAQKQTGADKLVGRVVYGESHPEAEARNLRSRVYQSYDTAGLVTSSRFDFKGNLTESARRLAREYRECPDWALLAGATTTGSIEATASPLLEVEAFPTTASFDALNRLSSRTTPDGSVAKPSYNEAGLLESLEVRVRGALVPTSFVESIEYNARGQRESIVHGNKTTTRYEYAPETFRLVRQATAKDSGAVLQDVTHTHDPVGNIVAIADAVSYGNPNVSADGLYEYNALYQLVKAEGREHPGHQPTDEDAALLGLPPEAHPNDWQALRRYREIYDYDTVGNILEMSHQPVGLGKGAWTRQYRYASDSNRLSGTSVPGDPAGTFSATYDHDPAGNMTRMPHLLEMEWDYANRLQHVKKQVQNGPGAGNDVFFTYDSSGQRVRKVYEHGGLVEERLYLGGYELYRKRSAGSGQVQLERHTLHVMDARRRVALVETKTVDSSLASSATLSRQRFELENHLGSSGMELDAAGHVISYEEYLPFGSSAFRASDSGIGATANRYRYVGKERDETTGLYSYGARYYAAWLGRWLSTDPSGFVDGLNLYGYVRCNPISRTDPTGGQSRDVVIPAQFTGKEKEEKLHEFARSHGYDFTAKPRWVPGKGWDVGQLSKYTPPTAKANKSGDEDAAKVAGQGAVTTLNASERAKYEKAIKEKSTAAVEKIRELKDSGKSGAAVEAWEEAKGASEFREAARDATREKRLS